MGADSIRPIEEFHRRVECLARESGMPAELLAGLHLNSLAGLDARLAAPDGRTHTLLTTPDYDAVNIWIEKIRPALVVLDTLADLFGGEENARAHAQQFVQLLRGVAFRNETTIVMLAHPSLSGMSSGAGTSGSTAWNNSVRSRLYLTRVLDGEDAEQDPDARILRVMKANYGRKGLEIPLRWQHGVFVTVGYTGGDPIVRATSVDQLFLELLGQYTSEGRTVSASPTSNYAPRAFSKDARGGNVRKSEFEAAMNRLFATGRIQTVEFGPPSHRRKKIQIKIPPPST